MNNIQIKLINCFIKYLPSKIIDSETFYVLRDDELSNNKEILDVCIDNNQDLVRHFKLKNWCSVRGAKKRVLQTIRQILTNVGVELNRKIVSKEDQKDGKRFQSTQGIYLFKWDNENMGEFNKGDFIEPQIEKESPSCLGKEAIRKKKEYYKSYYIKNKIHILQTQKAYRELKFSDNDYDNSPNTD